MNSCHSRS